MSTAYQSGSRRSTSGTSRSSSETRGQSRSRSGSAQRSTSGRSTSSSRNYYSSSGSSGRSRSSRRRKNSTNYRLIAILGVLLILLIAVAAYSMSKDPGKEPVESTSEEETTTTVPETELEKEVTVDGISITGLSRDEAREKILKNYIWDMKVSYQGDVYEMTNLMGDKVEALLTEIYTGTPKSSYTLDTSGLDDAIAAQVSAMAQRWNKTAKNGSISGYDKGSDSFTFTGEVIGFAIDEDKLKADIQAAIRAKDFDAKIQVTGSEVMPEITQASAKDLYKTIGTYTTNTTNNSNRNTNVRLAAETLNGTIIQPGEELSFNNTVGQRTEAKGYKSAGAYNNGEVVQEIGGGVCQVSTTLYNAVLKAGLKITRRQSHTFEPSYVTPGMDATVSWGGPDFCFVNSSKAAVGIRASYYNQTVTVSVYGIPVLEDGVTYSLESTKLSDTDPPAPTYEEDQTLQPGEEVVVSAGSKGSRWETRLVIKKNGEIVSRDVDHTVTYKGHAGVVRRNTSGVVIPAESESGQSVEETTETPTTPSPTSPVGPGESGGPGVSGPGITASSEPTAPAPAASEGSGGTVSPGPGSVTQPQDIPVGPGISGQSSDNGVISGPPIAP